MVTQSPPPPTIGGLLPDLQQRLFGVEDSVCLARARLVTEAWQRHADEPLPLRRALALEHTLAHLPLDLHTNPVFAGNTSASPRAWTVMRSSASTSMPRPASSTTSSTPTGSAIGSLRTCWTGGATATPEAVPEPATSRSTANAWSATACEMC